MKSTDGGATLLPATCAVSFDPSFEATWVQAVADPVVPARIYVSFALLLPAFSNSRHIYFIRSTDGGASWSAPIRVDDVLPDDVVDHYVPSLSISGNGRLDLIWGDYRNSTPKRVVQNRQPGDVYYSFSKDGGITWSANLRLSQSTAPFLYGAGNDYLTVASSGNKAHAIYAQDLDGNGLYEARLTTITFH